MLLIADSGSTKTDWVLVNGEERVFFSTEGLNPFFKSEYKIIDELLSVSQINKIKTEELSVFFYGAGCSSVAKKKSVFDALNNVFSKAVSIKVEHDLLGAAIATCGDKKGVCAILGTGSNSCLFDGEVILQEQVSLGYILGDEGAGTHLGKKLITDFLYDAMPTLLVQKLQDEFQLSKAVILDKIYRGETPNRYLASFATWIKKHIDEEEYLQKLVNTSFVEFITTHLLKYPDFNSLPFNVVGSVGFHFVKELNKALEPFGSRVNKVIKKPIDGLVAYHSGV